MSTTTFHFRPAANEPGNSSKHKGGESMLTFYGVQLRGLLARMREEAGQGLAEYALILFLIAVVAVVVLTTLGGDISSILGKIGSDL